MSAKKDGRGMLDMLEKMGMIKKIESDLQSDAVYDEQENPSETEQGDIAASTQPVYEPTPQIRPEPAMTERLQQPREVQTESYQTKKENITSSFWDDTTEAPKADTERFLDIEALYSSFGLPARGTNTIFVIDEYMKALPDSLPTENKRAIVLRIVATSGFDFDKLLNDGIDRVTKLNDYAATFASHTDEIISKHNAEIEALERQINHVKGIITERKNLHKRQFLAIDGEAQKLKDILDFITK